MRNAFRLIIPAGVAACLIFAGISVARQHEPAKHRTPTTAPAAPAARDPGENDFVISPMRVQEMRQTNYMYKSFETSFGEMGDQIHATMTELIGGIKSGDVPVTGPAIFVYHGATPDPTKKFTLEIGFQVDESAKDWNDFKVKKLDEFRCASVLFGGSVQNMPAAYQQVFADLTGAGHVPTGESRELYLMWEDETSVNNVVLIQIGIK